MKTLVYVLALCASLANALTSVFQRLGVENAPADATLRLSLLSYAVRRGVWLLGFALMIFSFIVQAVALHFGRLSQVQPILTTELVFLAAILSIWFGFRMGRREWLGSLAVTAGLVGFLYFAHPEYGMVPPPLWRWAIAGAASAAAIGATIALALRGPRWWRAAMFGTSAAISYAFTAACTKVVSDYAADDWTQLYRHWQTYALAFFGVLAVFLTQNAMHAGPIVASQSTLVLIDPLASILIGVGLFADNLQTNGFHGPLEALSLLVAFTGAFVLAHSPLISGLRAGGEYSESLSAKSRSRSHSATVPHAY
ncbi:MAG TPA: DMT family transporter [Streptosporangiaceae bacterium]|nr:DMT family transporter [Streptosporangiaceae bacterium]